VIGFVKVYNILYWENASTISDKQLSELAKTSICSVIRISNQKPMKNISVIASVFSSYPVCEEGGGTPDLPATPATI
jgi:hypothetical protein